jgi:CubicO group peptidase (beta-lactamase class C family)
VGVVGNRDRVLYQRAVGSFTYGQLPPRDPSNPAVTLETGWDMASCSKVMATTTAAAVLFQRGLLGIQDRVTQHLGPAFAASGKQDVRVVHLLTHDAGFPPDPVPGYWEQSFGCPETVRHPQAPQQVWDCNARIYAAVLNQTLDRPPGQMYVYSDLSFITMHYVVGAVLVANAVPTAPLRPECAAFDPAVNPGAAYLCRFEV